MEIVGEALTASATGEGYRPIAARLGRPAATVRGWTRRFTARAEMTLQHAMRCLSRFDRGVVRIEPDPAATPIQTTRRARRRRSSGRAARRRVGTLAVAARLGAVLRATAGRHELPLPAARVT